MANHMCLGYEDQSVQNLYTVDYTKRNAPKQWAHLCSVLHLEYCERFRCSNISCQLLLSLSILYAFFCSLSTFLDSENVPLKLSLQTKSSPISQPIWFSNSVGNGRTRSPVSGSSSTFTVCFKTFSLEILFKDF